MSSIVVRKSWAGMTSDERIAFGEAVDAMIEDGSYGELVWYHMHSQMDAYKMHSGMDYEKNPEKGDRIGGKRFLPWHRIYLAEFERGLRRHDKHGRNIFIPCWSWWQDGDIPNWDWIRKFHTGGGGRYIEVRNPSSKEVEGTIMIQRNPERPLPSEFVIRGKVSKMLHEDEYVSHLKFSRVLEGSPHNNGHVWVGGTMAAMNSPADPLFWMHHAEIDRLWEIWRNKNSHLPSGIIESDDIDNQWAILKPWKDHMIDDVLKNHPTKYGYGYDINLDDFSN